MKNNEQSGKHNKKHEQQQKTHKKSYKIIIYHIYITIFTCHNCVLTCSFQGHAVKNVGGALCSPLRSMMFGKFFCDTSACRRWGMPPAVYRRSEPMSDSLHCAMFNPYYVLSSPDSHQILFFYVYFSYLLIFLF